MNGLREHQTQCFLNEIKIQLKLIKASFFSQNITKDIKF
jgi:hypothetical protein